MQEAELNEVRRKVDLDLQAKNKGIQDALQAKNKEVRDALQQAEQHRQAAAQTYQMNAQSMSTANERVNSAEAERLKVQEDLKTQKEASEKEVANLKSKIQIAAARLQTQSDAAAANQN